MPEKTKSILSDCAVRGLILGGSIGLVAGLFGMDRMRAMILGLLCGFFAGLTRFLVEKYKK